MITSCYHKLLIKHQLNTEKAIENTNYKYNPDLSSKNEKVFHNPNTNNL